MCAPSTGDLLRVHRRASAGEQTHIVKTWESGTDIHCANENAGLGLADSFYEAVRFTATEGRMLVEATPRIAGLIRSACAKLSRAVEVDFRPYNYHTVTIESHVYFVA